jgi:hypothetical protein
LLVIRTHSTLVTNTCLLLDDSFSLGRVRISGYTLSRTCWIPPYDTPYACLTECGMALRIYRWHSCNQTNILFSLLLCENCVKNLCAVMDHNNIDMAPENKEIASKVESAESLRLGETAPEALQEITSYLAGWRLHVLTFT